MPTSPLVSVIVPVYNVERYLDECMNSIRQQTYPHLEIIVVEDASTDNSLRALEPHLADPRVRLLRHEKNSGLSSARNTGIETAKGDYVMFVDSDDVVDAKLVEACVDCVVQTGAEVVTYDFAPFKDGTAIQGQVLAESDLPFNSRILGDEYFGLPHFAWLKFIRGDLLRSSGMRFPVGLCYEDWPFHWNLGLAAKAKYQLKADFYHYRQRGTSITGSTGRKLLDLFAVQALVMKRVGALAQPGLRSLLANKMCDSHWRVLTLIDSDLLLVAIDKAKEAEEAMRANGFRADGAWRRRVIIAAARLPSFLMVVVVRLLRTVLRSVSPERRRLANSPVHS